MADDEEYEADSDFDIDDFRTLTIDEEGIEEIQRSLGIQVPDFLRTWFTENPLRNLEDDSRSLLCHVGYLVSENEEAREEGYFERKWPPKYLWIGDDWGGGVYFVDTSPGASDAVYSIDWESYAPDIVDAENCRRFAPSEFLDYVREIDRTS